MKLVNVRKDPIKDVYYKIRHIKVFTFCLFHIFIYFFFHNNIVCINNITIDNAIIALLSSSPLV